MLRAIKILGISSLSLVSRVNGGHKSIIDKKPIQSIGANTNGFIDDNARQCLELKSSKQECLEISKSSYDRSKLIEEIKLGETDMLQSLCNDDFIEFKELQNNILMASKLSKYPRIIKKTVNNCIKQNNSKNYSYINEIFILMLLVFGIAKLQFDVSISDPLNKYQMKKDGLNENSKYDLDKFENERKLGGLGFKKSSNMFDVNIVKSNRLLSETIQMLNHNEVSFFSLGRKEREVIFSYLKDPEKFLENFKIKKDKIANMSLKLEDDEFSSIYDAKKKVFELYKFIGMSGELLIKEDIDAVYRFYAKLNEKFSGNITEECWISLEPLNLTGVDNTGRHINSDVGKKALMAGNKNFNGETLEIIPDPIFDMVVHNYKMNGFI